MQKVFHFDAPRERYVCDAAIVWCFDNRFQQGFAKFLKRIGIVYQDPIKIAGAPRRWHRLSIRQIGNLCSIRSARRSGCMGRSL